MSSKQNVLILFGGESTEHEVSCISAKSVASQLDKEKYEMTLVGITKDGKWLLFEGPLEKMADGTWAEGASAVSFSLDGERRGILTKDGFLAIDVVFPVLHGHYGEDGTVQGLLELAHLPYVGTGVLTSAACMDKAVCKVLLDAAGIHQADWLLVTKKDLADKEKVLSKVTEKFDFPVFIKPANTGSSVGISKAHDLSELWEGLLYAAKYDRKILVEEFIDGHEVECSVIGNDEIKASVVGEILPANEFYDYEAKYQNEASKLLIPTPLPDEVTEEIRRTAVRAFSAVDGHGLSRIDFFVEKESGKIILNEINTMPGFTDISMYAKLWGAEGVSYSELLDRLIALALDRGQTV